MTPDLRLRPYAGEQDISDIGTDPTQGRPARTRSRVS
jgi:hypothetical protein